MRPAQTSQYRSVQGTVHLQGGASRSANAQAAACGKGATNPGAEVRVLVEWAVKMRKLYMQRGWSKWEPRHMREVLRPLEQWLLEHPAFVGPQAAKDFWAAHGTAIRHVMPGNAAGRSKLHQLEAILFAL